MRGATERADGICRNVTGFGFLRLDWFYGFGPTSILYLSYFVECGTYIIHENRGGHCFFNCKKPKIPWKHEVFKKNRIVILHNTGKRAGYFKWRLQGFTEWEGLSDGKFYRNRRTRGICIGKSKEGEIAKPARAINSQDERCSLCYVQPINLLNYIWFVLFLVNDIYRFINLSRIQRRKSKFKYKF